MVYPAAALKEWDRFTIEQQGITHQALMERAAAACTIWILNTLQPPPSFSVFCGPGNNGGDGKIIAQLLRAQGHEVHIYIYGPQTPVPDQLPQGTLIIDALWGSGLKEPLAGNAAHWVRWINGTGAPVLSIDLPSGLLPDGPTAGDAVVRAAVTLTLGTYKTALLLPEGEPFAGRVHLLDIGLHPGYPEQHPPRRQVIDQLLVKEIYRPRSRFGHKGTYGHALVAGGSLGKCGAVLMAAAACLRGGAGLTSVLLPECGFVPLQTALPEAMVLPGGGATELGAVRIDWDRYHACGFGPGMGTSDATALFFRDALPHLPKNLVLDADALNLVAREPGLLPSLPSCTLLTPHPKEFDRMFGPSGSGWERLEKAERAAQEHGCIIILKGHHTLVTLPGGRSYFNTTGNPGMAKGGSGDVLTGLLTALLAQGYGPVQAALLGVFLHGRAGDLAAAEKGEESMLPTDLIAELGAAFTELRG